MVLHTFTSLLVLNHWHHLLLTLRIDIWIFVDIDKVLGKFELA